MYSEFKTALDAYLAANWTDTPIYDFANNPGKPPPYDSWIGYKVVFMQDEVQSVSEGPHCAVALYNLAFSVCIGSAQGQDEAIALSETLKSLFLGKQLADNMWFREIDTEFGVKEENESSGAWYKTVLFVSVEHRYQL